MSRPKTVLCNKGCGTQVWFDWNARAGEPGRSDRGKMIPLVVDEHGELLQERHNCPNSTWGKTTEAAPQAQQSSVALSNEIVGMLTTKLQSINEDIASLSMKIHQANESQLERLDKIIADLKEHATQE